MIGIESAALSVGAAALGGVVAIAGNASIPEGSTGPWTEPVGIAALSGITCYVITLAAKAWQRDSERERRLEERCAKQEQTIINLLREAGKTGGSGSGQSD